MSEELSLKWGTVKSYELDSDGPAFKALKLWADIDGVSMSAMMQHNNAEQKQALCVVIDKLDSDKVYLEWDDRYVSKDEAKRYIMEYRS